MKKKAKRVLLGMLPMHRPIIEGFVRGYCYYCGDKLTLETVTKDHSIPKSRRGIKNHSNHVPACETCNHRKSDLTENEFFLIKAIELMYSNLQIKRKDKLRKLIRWYPEAINTNYCAAIAYENLIKAA